MSMKTLQGLGWQWCQNGVQFCVLVDGQKICVFVPLNRVWHEFNKELAAVGHPLPGSVGDPISVSGLFSSIAHIAKSAVHAVTHNAITKAASKVASTATNYAAHAISKIPVVGPLANSVQNLVATPLKMVEAIANGGRIDRAAMNALKSSLSSVKQIAPYATTVMSFVPGVGTGLNAAIGAGLALASGQNITDALASGVRNMLPGGEIAKAAFDVAHAAMQGKPITSAALAALPLPAAQKDALTRGLSMAKDLANGKRVDQALVDTALHALPASVAKAVQVGGAIGHAMSIQNAAGALKVADQLTGALHAGQAAASAIKALPAHVPTPPHLLDAVRKGQTAAAHVNELARQAQAGHPGASKLVSALVFHKASQGSSSPVVPGQRRFRPRYHTTPGTQAPTAAVGALFPTSLLRAAHRSSPKTLAGVFQAHTHHHHAHGGARGSFMNRPSSIFAR